MAGYTRRVQARLTDRHSFAQLVELIRTGPPRLSIFGLPGADEKLNLVEYFVHHEDVLRAQPDWQPRKVDAELADVLWDRLSLARLMLRKAPVGVELVRADGRPTAPPDAGARPSADHRQGPHAGRDSHRGSGRADAVDDGPDGRRGRADGRGGRRRRRAALGSLAAHRRVARERLAAVA